MKRFAFGGLLALAVLGGCQTTQPAGESLAGEQIKTLVSGKTTAAVLSNGQAVNLTLNGDGTAALSGAVNDTGKWRIADNTLCNTWNTIRGGQERCFTIRKSGAQYLMHHPDGSLNATLSPS